MIRLFCGAACALFLALPAAATTIDTMAGTWSGEGVAAHRGEPGQRFRCRITLRPQGTGTAMFSGRCATAQGQQSFSYLVLEQADGAVSAQNRSEPPDMLPPRLSGRAGDGTVLVENGPEAMFELRLDADRLRLRIQGMDRGTPTRGEVFLTRQ